MCSTLSVWAAPPLFCAVQVISPSLSISVTLNWTELLNFLHSPPPWFPGREIITSGTGFPPTAWQVISRTSPVLKCEAGDPATDTDRSGELGGTKQVGTVPFQYCPSQ